MQELIDYIDELETMLHNERVPCLDGELTAGHCPQCARVYAG